MTWEGALGGILAIWRMPETQSVVRIFRWLASVDAMFWLLARGAGWLVSQFAELFWEELWGLVAAVYNIALALLFSAVIFLAASLGAGPDSLLWRESCGFILLYIALGAAYVDPETLELDEEGRPGYALGLAAFPVFAAFPRLVARPELLALHELLRALAQGWAGRVLSALVVAGVVWNGARRTLRVTFFHLSPLLWRVGLLRLPPIRVRKGVRR